MEDGELSKDDQIDSIYMDELRDHGNKKLLHDSNRRSSLDDIRAAAPDTSTNKSKISGGGSDDKDKSADSIETEAEAAARKKKKTKPPPPPRGGDKILSAISPIMENRDQEDEDRKEYYAASYTRFLEEQERKAKAGKSEVALRDDRHRRDNEQPPYFISGGYIPNSILVRILWPPNQLNELADKSKAWKPKMLSEDQMEQLRNQKPVRPVSRYSTIFV